jgi:hypothetical protein
MTKIEEEELAHLMREEVRATETSSGTLDVAQAMSVGRRQRWYGRAAGAAVITAAVVAGTAVAPGLFAGTGRPAPIGIDAGAIAEAPKSIDPTVEYVHFGWLPEGLPSRMYQAGLTFAGTAATAAATPTDRATDTWRGVAVTLYPRGVVPPPPQRDSGEPAGNGVSSAAPAVQGNTAVWVAYQGATVREAFLRWTYAPQAWIEVRVGGLAGAQDPRTVAHKVAENVQLSTTASVPLPAAVTGLPSGVRLINMTVTQSAGPGNPWSVGMDYSTVAATSPVSEQLRHVVDVILGPYHGQDTASDAKGYQPPNTTIDGHPAYQYGKITLQVYNVEGVNIACSADAEVADRLGPAGCRSVYQHVQLTQNIRNWASYLLNIPG